MSTRLKDIAILAGVSTATVSKVINGKDDEISDSTIRRVLRIAREQNYRPNSLARSMKTKITRTIGLIIPDVRNPFFTDLARGAEDSANARGYSLLFCNSDDDMTKEMAYIDTLTRKQVDGIALAGAVGRDQSREESFDILTPMVTLDRAVGFKGIQGHVQTDNAGGAYDATRYLIGLGHRRILFLNGILNNTVSEDRLAGYRKALADDGLPFDRNLVREGDYSFEFGYRFIMNGMLDPSVTAIFCGNDLIALGCIKGLKRKNIRVPEDISIMGFDDIYLASITSPELTTVRQPGYEMGFITVKRLIDIIEGLDETDPVEVKLKLVLRETTAPPRQTSEKIGRK